MQGPGWAGVLGHLPGPSQGTTCLQVCVTRLWCGPSEGSSYTGILDPIPTPTLSLQDFLGPGAIYPTSHPQSSYEQGLWDQTTWV